jgi:uncharacterized protein YoxC
MTNLPAVLATALFAVFVGAALPVLYQLYQTLKRARLFIESAGPHVERTLDQVAQVAHRIDRIGSSLEVPIQTLSPVIETVSNVSHTIARTGAWLRTATSVGSAVGPAVLAGVRALFSRPRHGDA